MPVCGVIGCGKNKTRNRAITMHRIPKKESLKKLWLEAIGIDNLKRNKYIYICSVHFDDKCFNKTLGVMRLRDDAVPFKLPPRKTTLEIPSTGASILTQHKTGILKKETVSVAAGPDTPTLPPLKTTLARDTDTTHIGGIPSTGASILTQHKTGILKKETVHVVAGPDTPTLPPLKTALARDTDTTHIGGIPSTGASILTQYKTGILKKETVSVAAGPDTPTLTTLARDTDTTHIGGIPSTGASILTQPKTGILKKETVPVVAGPDPPTLPTLKTTPALHTGTTNRSGGWIHFTRGSILPSPEYRIKKLEDACKLLRKKVKILRQKLRRKDRRMEKLRNFVKDLVQGRVREEETSIDLGVSPGLYVYHKIAINDHEKSFHSPEHSPKPPAKKRVKKAPRKKPPAAKKKKVSIGPIVHHSDTHVLEVCPIPDSMRFSGSSSDVLGSPNTRNLKTSGSNEILKRLLASPPILNQGASTVPVAPSVEQSDPPVVEVSPIPGSLRFSGSSSDVGGSPKVWYVKASVADSNDVLIGQLASSNEAKQGVGTVPVAPSVEQSNSPVAEVSPIPGSLRFSGSSSDIRVSRKVRFVKASVAGSDDVLKGHLATSNEAKQGVGTVPVAPSVEQSDSPVAEVSPIPGSLRFSGSSSDIRGSRKVRFVEASVAGSNGVLKGHLVSSKEAKQGVGTVPVAPSVEQSDSPVAEVSPIPGSRRFSGSSSDIRGSRKVRFVEASVAGSNDVLKGHLVSSKEAKQDIGVDTSPVAPSVEQSDSPVLKVTPIPGSLRFSGSSSEVGGSPKVWIVKGSVQASNDVVKTHQASSKEPVQVVVRKPKPVAEVKCRGIPFGGQVTVTRTADPPTAVKRRFIQTSEEQKINNVIVGVLTDEDLIPVSVISAKTQVDETSLTVSKLPGGDNVQPRKARPRNWCTSTYKPLDQAWWVINSYWEIV